MRPKKYASFKEIDADLKILMLQREIDKESLKLTVNHIKNSFYPTNLLGGFGGIVKKIAISMVAKKLLNRFK